MNNENKYIKPVLIIISLDSEDIIRTSGEAKTFGNAFNSDNGDFWQDNI